jgi:acid phosphatase (class A)
MKDRAITARGVVAGIVSGVLLAGLPESARPAAPPTSPEVVGEFRAGSGYLRGYLDRKALPNSLALLPKPPAEGSAAHAADLAVYTATRAQRGSPRWNQAAQDANLKFPSAASTFACSMDLPISQEQQTPHLNMLLRRTLLDAGLSTYAAKGQLQPQASVCRSGRGILHAIGGGYPCEGWFLPLRSCSTGLGLGPGPE